MCLVNVVFVDPTGFQAPVVYRKLVNKVCMFRTALSESSSHCRILSWASPSSCEAQFRKNSTGLSTCTISTKMDILLKRYVSSVCDETITEVPKYPPFILRRFQGKSLSYILVEWNSIRGAPSIEWNDILTRLKSLQPRSRLCEAVLWQLEHA